MFTKQIGIDLGTANVIVYVRGKGIVLTEPSVVALAKEDGASSRPRIVAVGEEARLMLGRTPGNITAQKPMRDGVIADYVITEYMLKYFINKVCGNIRVFHPELMISVPSGVTSVERRAVKDAAIRDCTPRRWPQRVRSSTTCSASSPPSASTPGVVPRRRPRDRAADSEGGGGDGRQQPAGSRSPSG